MLDFRGLFDAPVYASLATVVAVTPNELAPVGAWLVSLLLQPGNHPAEARAAMLGAGIGKGVFTRFVPGEEVLVLFPGGDLNAGVILGSLHNLAAGAPVSWLGTKTLIQDPLGVELRSIDGIPADGVVLGNFLAAFLTYAQAMSTFMTVLSTTPAAPASAYTAAVVTAANVFQAATEAFLTALTTSTQVVDPVSGGVGGAPYASTLIRSTA